MRSIRFFLTAALLSVVTLVNFVAALRGYHVSMREAQALFTQRMAQQVELLEYTLPDLLARGDIRDGQLRSALALASDASLQFQWRGADGRLLARSGLMPVEPIVELTPGHRFANFNGYRWHVLVAPSAAGDSWFVLAERDDQRFRMAESIIRPAVYPMLLAIPLLGLTIWIFLGIGLRPVRQLAADLEQREAGDLRALDESRLPVELLQLTQSINALLARLAASFARETRFASDAAHELKSPIAALSIQCENLAINLPEHAPALAKLQAGIARMSHVVSQILMLSRVSPDQYMGRFEELDPGESLCDVVATFSGELQARALDIEATTDDCRILGDRYAIDSLIGNLISNAIKYSPDGGQIRVSVESRGDRVVLAVCDSGPGIPAELRERVFDRFYRIGGDQHDPQAPGCGLGLSIVRQVADLHHAEVRFLDPPTGSGLRVEVSFAAATRSRRAPRPQEPFA